MMILIALPFADSRWFQMAWLFFKTGLFSFGGAYASIVFLERGTVQQHHWLTNSQLLDGVALSVATPGPFMLFTTFAGFLAGGLRGALIATIFVFLPSFVFVLGGAPYIEMVRHNRWIQAFLAGASAAVVGVIIVVSLDLIPAALTDLPTITIALIAFLLIVVLKLDVAKVALGAMGAALYMRSHEGCIRDMKQAVMTNRSIGWRPRVVDYLSLERNVAIASAAVFLLGFGEELWKKFVPKYLEALGASTPVIGLFGTAEDFIDSIYQYPGGWIADRLGRRRAFLIFITLASAGYLVFLLSSSWPLLFLALALVMA